MASPSGQFHPWRLIGTFLGILVVLYALVIFTPGSRAPKLGIDLQGGTQVTLLAKTPDGSTPSAASMSQARTIMENRVNGSGVQGAQVQVDGNNQLVITVPGQEDLSGLTRSAVLNIRPILNTCTTDDSTSTSDSSSLCEWNSPDLVDQAAASESAAAASTATAKATTGTSTSGSGTTASGSKGTSAEAGPASGSTGATGSSSTAASSTTGSTAASTTSGSAGSTTAPTTSGSATASTGTSATALTTAPPMSVFPAGSDTDVPTQPADNTDAATWETAAAAYAGYANSALATSSSATASTTTSSTAAAPRGPTCADINYYQGLDAANKPLLSCSEDGSIIYLLGPTIVPGSDISTASSGYDSQSGHGWVVTMTLNSAGFKTWSTYTAANVNGVTGITLDSQVISATTIQSAINTPQTEIYGGFTQTSASQLADSLKFGALPLHFQEQNTEQISAELGLQYLQGGLIAGGIGLLLVILYCLAYYRLLGIITILSLVLSGSMVYAVMVLLGRWIGLSLDLPGIAGLIIAIGITADSFVVYFERIKDEIREGRTFRSSTPRAWVRARRTILSADAVSFLSAAILYILAVGDVKGFAFTLGLSTVLDLVVVFLVTHPLVTLASGTKLFSSPRRSGLGSVDLAGKEHRAATRLVEGGAG